MFPFIDAEYDSIHYDIPKNIVEKGYIFYKPIGDGSFKIFFEATDEAESWSDYKEYEFEFSIN